MAGLPAIRQRKSTQTNLQQAFTMVLRRVTRGASEPPLIATKKATSSVDCRTHFTDWRAVATTSGVFVAAS